MTPWNCIPSGLERRRYSSSLQRLQYFFVVLIQLFFAGEVATFSSSPSSTLASLFSPLLPGCLGFTMTFTYSASHHHLVFFIVLVFVFFFIFHLPVHQLLPTLTATWLLRSMLKRNVKKMFVVNVVEALTSRHSLSEHQHNVGNKWGNGFHRHSSNIG